MAYGSWVGIGLQKNKASELRLYKTNNAQATNRRSPQPMEHTASHPDVLYEYTVSRACDYRTGAHATYSVELLTQVLRIALLSAFHIWISGIRTA